MRNKPIPMNLTSPMARENDEAHVLPGEPLQPYKWLNVKRPLYKNHTTAKPDGQARRGEIPTQKRHSKALMTEVTGMR